MARPKKTQTTEATSTKAKADVNVDVNAELLKKLEEMQKQINELKTEKK